MQFRNLSSGTYVFMKLSDRSHLILHNRVPAKFVWAVPTLKRAVSAAVSMGRETHPAGSSRGQQSQQRRLQHLALPPINHHPTPALVSALVERLHSSQCRLVRNRKMLPNHLPFNSVLNFSTKLQELHETMKATMLLSPFSDTQLHTY